ncbi:MAG: response regulator [Ignavibacteriae bacterium]|nr:MAG: response regulator [Ignavibacteriota bacterium]
MKNERKILIVDDDRDLCNLIYEIIKNEGYTVHKVYDGNTAINEIKNKKYDLMIIDNKLGKMSGIQVIENTKNYFPELKTLMISAFGNNTTKCRAYELGVFDFIDKPFDISNLINKVSQVFSSTGKISHYLV